MRLESPQALLGLPCVCPRSPQKKYRIGMTKLFIPTLTFLFLLFSSSAVWAEEPKGVLCKSVDGTKEDLPIRLIQYDIELIRLRFTGLEPDRFFSLTKKGEYVQFATKKNTVSLMVNKVDSSSNLTVSHKYGGTDFVWKNGRVEKTYACGGS